MCSGTNITHIQSIRDGEANDARWQVISSNDSKQSRKHYKNVADKLQSHSQPAATTVIQPSILYAASSLHLGWVVQGLTSLLQVKRLNQQHQYTEGIIEHIGK